jgi:hypothetical protein
MFVGANRRLLSVSVMSQIQEDVWECYSKQAKSLSLYFWPCIMLLVHNALGD